MAKNTSSKRHPRTDRFEDMMLAVTGNGAAPCVGCTLIWPTSRLRDGLCDKCRGARAWRRGTLDPAPPVTAEMPVTDANIAYVDASFSAGIAGLAVVGAMGEFSQRVEARSSTHAEWLALMWAFDLARDRYTSLTFRTDCQAAWNQHQNTGKRFDWRVELISRSRNKRADLLAGRARLDGPSVNIPGGEGDATTSAFATTPGPLYGIGSN